MGMLKVNSSGFLALARAFALTLIERRMALEERE